MVPESPDPQKQDWIELGSRLREAREYLSLSQQDVSAATGVPRSAVSDIERGARKVDSLELRKFSKIYRRPVSYLLGEEESGTETVTALARAVTGLTEGDREEVIRFAQFLRHSAQTRTGDAGTGTASTDQAGTS